MSDYDNNNSGALFKNKRKVKQNQPDYTGKAQVSGTDFWISAWIQKSRAGETYMSIAFTEVEEVNAITNDNIEDDIPF